jgi:uncharacterized membrane protein HdeD (DUF308 family)
MTIGRRRLCFVVGIALIVAGSAAYVARPWLQLNVPFMDEHRVIFLLGWAIIVSGVSLVVHARRRPEDSDEADPPRV